MNARDPLLLPKSLHAAPLGLSAGAGAANGLGQAWQQVQQRQRHHLLSQDADEACDLVSRVFKPHRLNMVQPKEKVQMQMTHLDAGLLSFSSLRYGTTVDIVPGPLERFYLLQIPVRGQAHIASGQTTFDSDPLHASLLSPAPNLRMRWHDDNEQLCVRINADLIERFLTVWQGTRPVRLPTFESKLTLQSHPMLMDTLLQLLQVSLQARMQMQNLPCGFASTQPMADTRGEHGVPRERHQLSSVQLQYQVLVCLLTQQHHDMRERLQQATPPVAPACVRLVEDYILSHAHCAITPQTLAEWAGVSVRSLFLGFHRYRGTSPMKFLRQVRMQRVRDELLTATPGTRIGELIARWGFDHAGRFSLAYAAQYGEHPRETLKFARHARK